MRPVVCVPNAGGQAENQEGMAEVARFIEMNGSFADENRDW